MGLTIDLAVEHDAWLSQEAGLGDADALVRCAVTAALEQVQAAADRALPCDTEISILLCDDAFIRTLNWQWRGLDKATNVLSFPSAAAARALTLGDIVVAYETSRREADECGTPFADYLAHLIVHGLLHLLGFDHEEDGDAEQMEALEGRTLAALGVASPYDDVASAADLSVSAP